MKSLDMAAFRSEYILLVDDDQDVREALALCMEREGRTVIVCSDIESAELVFDHMPITHLISDVQFSGEFGFEGLHFLTRISQRQPDCRIILMSGRVTDDLRAAALAAGAAAVLGKPFAVKDLEIALRTGKSDEGQPYELVHVPSIDEILKRDEMVTVFQPIVSLDDAMHPALAFEALTRFRTAWFPGGAASLFDYATSLGRLDEINLAAAANAIKNAGNLPDNPLIFINLDPSVFACRDLPAALGSASREGKFDLRRVVLEITERSAFPPLEVAAPVIEELRAAGVRFALDDHGSAYSHLSAIGLIQPSFIKISPTFGTSFETDSAKERVIRHVVRLASDFGCETILEGVESAETGRAAISAGVRFAQGFHFGRPSPASHWTSPASC